MSGTTRLARTAIFTALVGLTPRPAGADSIAPPRAERHSLRERARDAWGYVRHKREKHDGLLRLVRDRGVRETWKMFRRRWASTSPKGRARGDAQIFDWAWNHDAHGGDLRDGGMVKAATSARKRKTARRWGRLLALPSAAFSLLTYAVWSFEKVDVQQLQHLPQYAPLTAAVAAAFTALTGWSFYKSHKQRKIRDRREKIGILQEAFKLDRVANRKKGLVSELLDRKARPDTAAELERAIAAERRFVEKKIRKTRWWRKDDQGKRRPISRVEQRDKYIDIGLTRSRAGEWLDTLDQLDKALDQASGRKRARTKRPSGRRKDSKARGGK